MNRPSGTAADAVRAELRANLHDLSDHLLAGSSVPVVLNCLRHLHALLTLAVLPDPDAKAELRKLLEHLGGAAVHDRPIDWAAYANRISREADRIG